MAKGYLIAHISVHDPERFEEFKAQSGSAIKQYGVRLLVRDPGSDHREGDLRGLTIMIEFDSLDAARAFHESDEYTAAQIVREEAADTDLLLTDGL